MKPIAPIIALSVAALTVPAVAQDTDRATAQEAAEAAADRVMKEPPVEAKRVPLPPPPVEIAIPPPSPNRNKAPGPKSFGMMRPKQADYPAASWAVGHEGRVRYEVEVSAEGKPTSCAITDSSGHKELDDTTCAIAMERGEFRPQIGEDHEPVAGKYKGSFSWRKREPEFANSFRFKARFLLDEKGEASECEILTQEGKLPRGMDRSIEREPCPFGGSSRRGPYRDENGVPVAKRITVEIAVDIAEPEAKPED